MRQIVTLTWSDAPNAFVQRVLCALCVLVSLPVWSQSEFCLEGTVWDATLGGCIPAESCEVEGDFNGDGVVGSADLLAFLTLYGNQYLDSDGDGLCDTLDDCNGVFDACGVCNGPGAIYDCGCEECAMGFVECGDPMGYQGYDYATVLIGGQCWFAENLRSELYGNGDAIPSGLNDSDWGSTAEGAMATYGEGSSTCTTFSPSGDACDEAWSLEEFGVLYNWHAVADTRALCPSGWHVPSNDDWTELADGLGGSLVAGQALKSESGWSNGGNGSNNSGFNGQPGGIRMTNGPFFNAGDFGYWWSSTPAGTEAWFRFLNSSNNLIQPYSDQPRFGFSVRCILDTETCSLDEDGDGICDDVDDCVGELDECGICNGPGAIYDCGCDECPIQDDCGSPVSYQGYDYATIQIGTQCWFAENLRSEAYRNGDEIPSDLSNYAWANTEEGATTISGEEVGTCADLTPDGDACDESWSLIAFGRLYNQYAIADPRGLCPQGWHVPTDEEWMSMELALGMEDEDVNETGWRGLDAGIQMKTDYGWYEDGNGSNVSGFSGLPGGTRSSNGWYYSAGAVGYWWTASGGYCGAWSRGLSHDEGGVSRSERAQFEGFSVRCLKDCDNDVDEDGICDEVDDCIPDECGVCNGFGLQEGVCDCEGNVLDECGVCNGLGAIYGIGADECHSCGNPMGYQGYDYATFSIAGQCWFAENLRSETYRNGDSIVANLGDNDWENANMGAMSVYGEGSAACYHESPDGDACDEVWALNEYGRLYNWYAVNDSRGLCPSGWRISTDEDWRRMEFALGLNESELFADDWRGTDQGTQLKTDFGWAQGGGGDNSIGFAGLPGGERSQNGTFNWGGSVGLWWSLDDPVECQELWRRALNAGGQIGRLSSNKWLGSSVRCIKDDEACVEDEDGDGICDDVDDCVGELDECGNCNGPGAIYDCGCSECGLFEGCGNPITYQGHTYATVQIGDQCWFAENLRSEQYANGQPIDSELSGSDWAITNSGAFAVYGEGTAACETNSPDGNACDETWSAIEYGHLYNWHAVSDERGLCPTGWHVPSDQEWTTLTNQYSGDAFAGEDLKMTYGWEFSGNGTNSSGFAGLPGGFREVNGVFELAGSLGCWWTSTPTGNNAWNRDLDAINSFVLSFDANLQSGFSVRCVLDEN